MHVLPNDIKIDERALDYAGPASTQSEFLQEYLAVLLSQPLPGDLLERLAESYDVPMPDAYAVICGYIEAVFLRPESER